VASVYSKINGLYTVPQVKKLMSTPYGFVGGMMYLDDRGVIGINFVADYNFNGILSEDVSLLSFDSVMKTLEKNLQDNLGASAKPNITLDAIDLMYYPLESPDNPKECTYIPVWAIGESEGLDESYIIINAIDGSVVEAVFHQH
jgi:hypothetical protein